MDGRIRFLVLTDPDKIWKPDLFFKNEKKGHLHNIIMPNVLLRIFPNGNVLYSIRISLVLFCPMHLKYYPLDQQTCFIYMASCKFRPNSWQDFLVSRGAGTLTVEAADATAGAISIACLFLIELCFLRSGFSQRSKVGRNRFSRTSISSLFGDQSVKFQ